MLCGQRPFRAGALGKLLRQVVQSEAESLRSIRPEIPEELEEVVKRALQKEPGNRYRTGTEFAADLTRVHQKLRASQAEIDDEERFAVMRKLRFFHDFSHAEIREVMRAGRLDGMPAGRARAAPGRHRRPVLHRGVGQPCGLSRGGDIIGRVPAGGCFGEAGYAEGSRRDTVVEAESAVTMLKVTATLLEQASISCQLRFNKVFLRELIGRLQRGKK